MRLRVPDIELEVDFNGQETVAHALVYAEVSPGNWAKYGEVTTSHPDQMQGLYNLSMSGGVITEEEFFGRDGSTGLGQGASEPTSAANKRTRKAHTRKRTVRKDKGTAGDA